MSTHEIDAKLYEAVLADFINETYIHLPECSFHRVNSGPMRMYIGTYPDGTVRKAAGITSILKKYLPAGAALLQWQMNSGSERVNWILENSGHFGTYFHILISRLFRKETISTDDEWLEADMQQYCTAKGHDFKELQKYIQQEKRDIKKYIYGFMQWVKDYKPEPLALEYPIIHDDFACTIDFVGYIHPPKEDKKKLVIVDWKTSGDFYESHEIQLVANKIAWDTENPRFPIEGLYNYGVHDFRLPLSSRVTPYKFKDQTERYSDKFMKLMAILALYSQDKVDIKPYHKIKSAEIGIDSDIENLIEEIDPIFDITGMKEIANESTDTAAN